jgi:conjugal transfer pilus assembly protein TraW
MALMSNPSATRRPTFGAAVVVAVAVLWGAAGGRDAAAQAGSAAAPTEVPRDSGSSEADLVVGPTYEIKEPSMLEEMMKKLRADEASGVMRRRMEEGQARALDSLQNPRPNDRISRASAPRTWYYDPSIVVTENIMAEGKVIVPAGTRVNPLDKVNWSKTWVFIDARDPPQLSYAKRAVSQMRGNAKVVLTGGKLKDTSMALGQAVYFDQGARLVSRFGIGATPATVRQEGKRLRIDEVLP